MDTMLDKLAANANKLDLSKIPIEDLVFLYRMLVAEHEPHPSDEEQLSTFIKRHLPEA